MQTVSSGDGGDSHQDDEESDLIESVLLNCSEHLFDESSSSTQRKEQLLLDGGCDVMEDDELLDLMDKLPSHKEEDGPLEASKNFSPVKIGTQSKEPNRSVQ